MTPEETLTTLLAIPSFRDSFLPLLIASAIVGLIVGTVIGLIAWFATYSRRVGLGVVGAITTILALALPFSVYRDLEKNKVTAITQLTRVLHEESQITEILADGKSYKVTVNPIEGEIFGQLVKGEPQTFHIRKTTAEEIEQEVFKPQGLALLER